MRDFDAASTQDTAAYKAFFHACSTRASTCRPSAYEAWFLSAAHDDDLEHGSRPRSRAAASAAAAARNGAPQ